MKIKLSNLVKLWVIFTLFISFILIYGIYQIKIMGEGMEVQECLVENQIVGLPSISVIEKEEKVIVEKENVIYDFPFEVQDLGNKMVVGSCVDCLPMKVYKNMRSNSEITAFASNNVLPEGTLVWIDGVGLRQIQGIQTASNNIYIFFNSHSEAKTFGEKTVRVFKVLE